VVCAFRYQLSQGRQKSVGPFFNVCFMEKKLERQVLAGSSDIWIIRKAAIQ